MRSEFQNLKISSICSLISSGGTPSRARDEYYTNGYIPWLKTKELFDTNIYDTEEYITDLGLRSSSAKLYPSNTVVLAMYGATVGKLGVMKSEMSTNQACCCMVVDDKKADYRFLFYSLLQNRGSLINLANGAAQQNLNSQIIKDFEIYVPSLPTQKKIAHTLSTLDDKIELNRKMNQTLEAMAQALFKSWFVDFDPVHVKLIYKSDEELEVAARELGISKEVLELFPSEFEESELGMIPKGWNNDFLDNFVEILDSKRIPLASNERAKRQGNIPYYGATSIMDYVDEYLFYETLLLMGEDGSVARDNGTPFLQYIWGKSWVNNHAHVMRSKSTFSIESLYIALLNQNVTMFVTGAVQPKINQGNLKQIPIMNAGEVINKIYSTLIEPMFAKVRLITEENITLQKTRDTLLPKLLSGELDVSEIEID
jgi:type I restriction enzyme S subunit